MQRKLLLFVLCLVLITLSGCSNKPSGQAIEIATPTRLVATETSVLLEPTATESLMTPPTATETAIVATIDPATATEVVAMPEATDTPQPVAMLTALNSDDLWAAIDPSNQNVTFWHRHTKFRQKILNEIVDNFNKNNPYGIWVKAESYEDYGKLFDSTMEALNSAEAPSLVLGFQSDLASYSLADGSVDLTSLFNSQRWGISAEERSDFFAWALDAELAPNLGNVRTGLPMDRSADVLFANRNWLDELGITSLPKTPEEFHSAACAASQQPFSLDKRGKGIGFELSDNASTFASWVFAFGGNIYDVTTGQFTLDSEEAQAAWTFVQGLIQEGCAQIAGERYGDQTDFGNGVALFAVGASNSFYFFNRAVEEGADFQWEVSPLPHMTEKAILNLSGPSIALIKSTPEQELAAWLFLKHYASAEMQAKWARAVEGFPIRGSAFEQMSSYLDDSPAYQSLVAFLPDGRSEPSVPGYSFIRSAMSDAIVAIAGGADVQATLHQLNAEANKMLEKQVKQ
ncbi:MAG: extracellular solute-binding protein [Caldilineaceae bacterium]